MAFFREIHIIGGGIAGLSAAYSLAGDGCHVTLWEKENLLCKMSSARNAAIFRTYESDPTLSYFVKESFLELCHMEVEAGQLMDRRGLLIDPLELDYYEHDFLNTFPDAGGIMGKNSTALLEDGSEFSGILLPQNGVMDIHRYQEHLLKKCSNLEIKYNSGIQEIAITGDKIQKLTLAGGDEVSLPQESLVINAAGAWAASLTEKNGVVAPPVIPYKRHLFFLKKKNAAGDKGLPVIWDEKHDIYFRPESGGLLATHGDQRESVPGDYSASDKEVDRFQKSITHRFPFLAEYHISRYWACLRTFSLDQHPTIGYDPVVKNLFWVAGLGGRGMTMSPALTRKIRDLVYGEGGFNPFTPARFL